MKNYNNYQKMQRGFLKLSKNIVILILGLTIIGGAFIYFLPQKAEAAWFNDNWAYRKRIDLTITSSASDISNLDTLITIDTTGITANLQTNCEDLRFTNIKGDILPYFIDTCSDNSATNKVWVRANLVPKDTTTYTIYMYYGNAAVAAATNGNLFNLYNNLVGYWTVNESSGNATDVSAKGNNLTNNNTTTYVSGQYANAASFVSASSQTESIADGSQSGLESMAAITVSAWVNPTTMSDQTPFVVKDSSSGQSSYSFRYNSDGSVVFEYSSNGTYQGNSGTSATGMVTTGSWQHFVATYDGATIRLYKDGVEQTSGTFPKTGVSGSIFNSTSAFSIGGGTYNASTVYVNGKMDDIRVYGRALSNTEVTQLNSNPGSITTTVNTTSKPTTAFATAEAGPTATLYWKFDDGQGTTSEDSTTNGLDATLAGVTGTATGSQSSTTLADTSKTWTTNAYRGAMITLTGGTGSGQVRTIKSNTSTAVTVDTWTTTPVAASTTYTISPSWQTENYCISGKCLFFTGNEVNASKADDDRIDFAAADNFTVSAWVKRNGTASANSVILQKSGANISSTYTGYKLYMDASGDFCFDIQDGTNAVDTACTSAVDFDDDSWHLVHGVKVGTTSVTLYVDGKQRAQDASVASTSSLANASTFRVGTDSDGTSNEWLGSVDEVKITRDQSARTAAQVLADYNARGNPEGLSQQAGNNAQNISQALSNSLVGYWKMDENSWTVDCSTTSVLDSSGNNLNGAACPNSTGPAGGGIGKFGKGGLFDGANDGVDVADNDLLDVTASQNKSWSFWVKRTGSAAFGNSSYLIAKRNLTTETGYDISIGAQGSNCDPGGSVDDKICFGIGDGTNSYKLNTTNAVLTADSIWHHVAVVLDRSSETNTNIFVDGIQQAATRTGTFSSVGSLSNSNNDCFGGDMSGTSCRSDGLYALNGSLDDIRIYNRALSASDVSQLASWAPPPVAYWKMDEGTGTTIKDASGNGNNSSAFTGNTAFTTGKYGAGLTFDGTNDTVRIPETPSTDLGAVNDSFTVSAWIKTTQNVGANTAAIVNKDGAAAGNFPFDLYLSSSENLIFETSGTPSGDDIITGGSTLNDGNWHYVTGVRDKSGGKVYVYVDGKSDAAPVTITNTNISSDNDDISIGNGGGGSYITADFNGKIDDVKIYNYARSPSQITEDMNASHPAPGSPVGTPVGWWKFNEGAENTCSGGTNDVCNSGSGGSAIDGTLTASSRTTAGKNGSSFDGSGGATRVDVADNDRLDFLAGEDLSVSAWFKTDSATNPSNGNEFVVYKKTSATLNTVGYALYFTQTTGTLCFGIDDDTSSFPEDSVCSATDVYDGNWHHVVASLNRSGVARMDVYIDGLVNGTADTTISATGTLANAGDLFVGDQDTDNNATASTEEFAGNVDDVKLFHTALTQSQAQLDMNQGSTEVLGALSDKTGSGYESKTNANQEYCIPGDSSTCTAPTHEYRFEERTGTTNYDTGTAATLRNGTMTSGPTFSTGKQGSGVQFDGSNDYITTGAEIYDELTAFTLSMWINLNSTSADGHLIGDITDDTTALGFIGSGFGGVTNGLLYCGKGGCSDAGSTGRGTTTNSLFTTNKWYHVAMTFNGTGGADSCKFYVNGVDVTSDDDCGETSIASTTTIGGTSGSITLNGKMDLVRTYNYVRSPAQIAWEYNRGGPVGFWKMDECQGTTINDSSGMGNTGTLTIGGTGTYTTPGTCGVSSASTAWYNGATGKRNASIALDGTNDYVDVGNPTSLKLISNLSLSGWVYLGRNNTAQRIISKAGTSGSSDVGYMLYVSNTGKPVLTVSVDGTTLKVLTGNSTLNTGTWYHITGVYSASTIMNIYVNGVLDNTTSSSVPASVFNSTANVGLGATIAGPGALVQGQLDDLKIFNYALTETQVKTNYNQGALNYSPTTGNP